MHIIKIGEKILNMDQVIEIKVEPKHVSLFFPARYAVGGNSINVVHVEGSERTALLRWLENNV